MIWTHDKTKPISAKEVNLYAFTIVGPDGKPVSDLEPYMGMGGHAEFVKQDGSVFAHIHPQQVVSMASVAIASPSEMMAMHQTDIGSTVSFPYGVPTPGRYRIFVQLKRAGKVETGAFDLTGFVVARLRRKEGGAAPPASWPYLCTPANQSHAIRDALAIARSRVASSPLESETNTAIASFSPFGSVTRPTSFVAALTPFTVSEVPVLWATTVPAGNIP